jgi:hypothetical protein
MAVGFVAMLILLSGGDDTPQEPPKNLRSPAEQASVPSPTAVQIQQEQEPAQLNIPDTSSANVGDMDEYNNEIAEEELEIEVEVAMGEVDEAEEEEIEVNDSMLVTAVKAVEDNVKFYLGKIFGSGEEGEEEDESEDDDATSEDTTKDVKLSGEQLDEIAKKISDKLEEEVKTEFREKADEVRTQFSIII